MTFTIPLWLLILLLILGIPALALLGYFAWMGWAAYRIFWKGVWR